MSNFLSRFGLTNDDPKMQKAALYSKFQAARVNLLLMIGFSLANIISLLVGGKGYLLFCSSFSYIAVDLGMTMCGFKTEEFYKELGSTPVFDKPFIAVFIIIALLVLTLYLLCWIFSKKRGNVWLKIALALISADTMGMFLMGNLSTIIFDAVFHIWFIISLFVAISAYDKLRAIKKQELLEESAEASEEIDTSESDDNNS